jgi:hypothetical protein
MMVERISELGTLAVTSNWMWILQEPHDVTPQKTVFFIVTAVKTSNLTANMLPASLILCTLKMEPTRSSKTSALTRATRHHIPEDNIMKKNVLLYDGYHPMSSAYHPMSSAYHPMSLAYLNTFYFALL